MPKLLEHLQKIARRFSSSPSTYDATDDRGRRRPPRTQTASEDYFADDRRRRILSATAADLARNWVLLAWAVRKHLDFVADFTFQAKTRDAGFNKDFEAWQLEAAKRLRFDVAARHSQRRAVRLAEAGKTINGDHFWLKIAPNVGNPTRGTIQAIEGDRIVTPTGLDMPRGFDPTEWVNGLRLFPDTGKVREVAIHRRLGTRKELQRIVSARNIFQHANYEFRSDQVRGVSPLASALNFFQDTYEGFDYTFAKLKIGQLFGVAITSNGSESAFAPPPDTSSDEADASDETTTDSTQPLIDLKRGPFVTELEEGEKTEIIESKTPSTETVNFLKLAMLIVIRTLDIPYSFLDESFTNFYGSRGGMIQYLHACNNKVIDLQDLQDDHLRWRAGLAVADGELVLPSGKEFDFLKWEFVPGGVAWWDATKEVRGAAMSIAAGFSSPQRVCREIGTNFEQNVAETAEAMQIAEAAGVPLTFADSSAFAPEITVNGGASNGN